MKIADIKETDVAEPIERFLENLGYTVRSEVNDCDITATKEDELLVVECKKSLSLKLIYQALDRQEFSDSVYIAIPLLAGKQIPNQKHLMRLCKRLEMGIIIVHFLKTKQRVEVLLDPREYRRVNRVKKRQSVLSEIANRSRNFNTGGTKGSVMTAYKENVLEVARHLHTHEKLNTKKLKELGTGDKTYSILYKNFYGFFQKSDKKGYYELTDIGKSTIVEFDSARSDI